MNKYASISRNIIWWTCLVFFLWGCEKPAEPPSVPKVVRKKIVVQEDASKQPQTAKPAAAEPVKPSPGPSPAPPALPESKAVAGISTAAETPPAKPVATSPGPSADISQAPKPDLEPKSEISMLPKSAVSMTDEDKVAGSPSELAAVSLDKPKEEEIEKIDPFAPLFKEEVTSKPEDAVVAKTETKRRIPLTPLEKVDLSQLKLVGIVRAQSGEKALVEEASGKGYIVTKGTYIGLNAGRVLQIMGDGIVIEEEIEDALGKVTIVRTELKLQKPPGEF